MKPTNIKTLGVVLAGGAGSRLGGLDKGLQVFQGITLVEHVIHALGAQADGLLVCANRNIETYREFGYPVIEDQKKSKHQASLFQGSFFQGSMFQEFQGPMAGINAAINFILNNEHLSTVEQLLIAPCDAPKLPCDYAKRLSKAKSSIAFVHDGQRQQNLHCLITRSQWASLQSFYNEGGRAIHRWFEQVNALMVDFSDKRDCFVNINRPDELLALNK